VEVVAYLVSGSMETSDSGKEIFHLILWARRMLSRLL